MGWGLDVHWAALAREHGWRCGVLDAVAIAHSAAPAGEAYSRAAARRRGARVPRRAPLPDGRRSPAHARHPPTLVKVAVVAEFYPRQRDPVLGVWAHRQALAARPRAPRCTCSCCTASCRRARRWPRAQLTRRARSAACCASLGTSSATASSHLRPLRLAPAAARLRRRGAPGRRRRWRVALRRLRRAHRLRPDPRPQRRPRRRCRAPRAASTCRWSSRCTAATCSTPRPAPPPAAQAVARGLGAARLVLANSRGIAELARAHGAHEARVVHLGADPPSAGARAGRRARAGHRRPSRRAQAPRRRAARARRAARPPPHAALRDRRRRPRARRPRRARARLGIAERVRVLRAAPPRRGDRARAALHAVRDALHRGGLRRRLHRGDGRRPARDRLPRRARPGGDRRRRRRLRARAPGRHRAPHPAHRRAALRPRSGCARPAAARGATVAAHFTWERCGEQTLAAYEHALR